MMPPSYVRPYVKRQKKDAPDAEAICEAVTRPTMRFTLVKTEAQQAAILLHRTREFLFRSPSPCQAGAIHTWRDVPESAWRWPDFSPAEIARR